MVSQVLGLVQDPQHTTDKAALSIAAAAAEKHASHVRVASPGTEQAYRAGQRLRMGPSKAGLGRAGHINASNREGTLTWRRRHRAHSKIQAKHSIDVKQGLQHMVPGHQH